MTEDQLIVRMRLLPSGALPKRQTQNTVGYDAYLRAIVSPFETDPDDPHLHLTVFDFKTQPAHWRASGHIFKVPCEATPTKKDTELVYRLNPGESVLGGIGFVAEMPFPLFCYLVSQNELTSKHHIVLVNAGVPLGADFRGEPVAELCNMHDKPFYLRYGMRIAQIIFQQAHIPKFELSADTG